MGDGIVEMLYEIRNGNEKLKSDFIQDYMPFIIKTVSKYTERYVDVNNSDELSIGMSAFCEAINRYEGNKGSFLNFAEIVIRSRLLDFLRKENKQGILLSIEEIDEPSYSENINLKMEIKEEVKQFADAIKNYNITFSKLEATKPKHADTRKKAIEIAHKVIQNDILMSEIKKRKRLPYKSVALYCNTTEKVVKKSEKYIIACIIILASEWEHMKAFVKGCIENG